MKFPRQRRGPTAWRYDSAGTYFNRRRFSINEGEYPNIHVSWRGWIGFYVALSPRLKWHWFR